MSDASPRLFIIGVYYPSTVYTCLPCLMRQNTGADEVSEWRKLADMRSKAPPLNCLIFAAAAFHPPHLLLVLFFILHTYFHR